LRSQPAFSGSQTSRPWSGSFSVDFVRVVDDLHEVRTQLDLFINPVLNFETRLGEVNRKFVTRSEQQPQDEQCIGRTVIDVSPPQPAIRGSAPHSIGFRCWTPRNPSSSRFSADHQRYERHSHTESPTVQPQLSVLLRTY
jgi:hypothetical protein